MRTRWRKRVIKCQWRLEVSVWQNMRRSIRHDPDSQSDLAIGYYRCVESTFVHGIDLLLTSGTIFSFMLRTCASCAVLDKNCVLYYNKNIFATPRVLVRQSTRCDFLASQLLGNTANPLGKARSSTRTRPTSSDGRRTPLSRAPWPLPPTNNGVSACNWQLHAGSATAAAQATRCTRLWRRHLDSGTAA